MDLQGLLGPLSHRGSGWDLWAIGGHEDEMACGLQFGCIAPPLPRSLRVPSRSGDPGIFLFGDKAFHFPFIPLHPLLIGEKLTSALNGVGRTLRATGKELLEDTEASGGGSGGWTGQNKKSYQGLRALGHSHPGLDQHELVSRVM